VVLLMDDAKRTDVASWVRPSSVLSPTFNVR